MSKLYLSLNRLKKALEAIGVSSDPIMVLGMHRSGTTLLVQILQRLGYFMGGRLSGNLEPRVFQDANRQLFDYFNATWIDGHLLPSPYDFYRGFPGLAMNIAERLSEDLPVGFFDSFIPHNPFWGFKDPRLSITAALFLRLFPDAKAIFVYRNPLDVAWSIAIREKKKRRKYPGFENFEFNQTEYQEIMMRAIKAWEVYNERAIEGLPLFSQYTLLRYEDLVLNPLRIVRAACAEININCSEKAFDGQLIFHTNRVGSAERSGIDLSPLEAYLIKSNVMAKIEQSVATKVISEGKLS